MAFGANYVEWGARRHTSEISHLLDCGDFYSEISDKVGAGAPLLYKLARTGRQEIHKPADDWGQYVARNQFR